MHGKFEDVFPTFFLCFKPIYVKFMFHLEWYIEWNWLMYDGGMLVLSLYLFEMF